ncbi:hypothetical protein [Nocardioides sp. L-11A]|uniref:hypothetical protein n=1 Tax=Nocardioides sp. L-11A TaxID=3043848 RepID=UPI00249A12D3|nr:hypothetical protein QJ852_09975 [Nocardioides sp. L-11A]
MSYTVRPLSDRTWLRPASKRTATRFSSKWKETEKLLLEEVAHLDGRQLVIEVDVREQDLRLDGTLRANAREAATPGVVVAFESKHGPMLHRCDTFYAPYAWQGPDWQHNVRALALTLQALRAVGRYGATETGQQYQGFKAIGGGTPMPAAPKTMSREDARAVLVEVLGTFDGSAARGDTAAQVRRARGLAHPDRHGGDHTLAYRVDEAARVLGVSR